MRRSIIQSITPITNLSMKCPQCKSTIVERISKLTTSKNSGKERYVSDSETSIESKKWHCKSCGFIWD